MSTHRLDVSGARPLTTTTNDPAATVAQTPAKAGDDVTATLSGFRELRVSLGDGSTTRLERRRYIRKTMRRHEGGAPVKENGEYVYDEKPEEELVLVFANGGTFFGRTSNLTDAETESAGAPAYEPTPHTNVVAKRWGELHFLESGQLIEQGTVADLLEVVQRVVDAGKTSGGSDEVGTPDTLTPKG